MKDIMIKLTENMMVYLYVHWHIDISKCQKARNINK